MGLVLGGGGSRGCYEIGVWEALALHHIKFDVVAGTSIGAIVGAVYVQQTLDPLVEFVYHLQPSHIAKDLFDFPETFEAMLKERKAIKSFMEKYIFSSRKMDISPLKGAIAEMFDYEKFAASDIDYACMTFNVTKMEPEAYFKSQMTAHNAQDIILASASCYPAFPMLEMNGSEYIDGGYYSNVPIRLALDMKAEKILAVDVEGPGMVRSIPAGVDVLLIKPILPLQNFLDFSNEQAIRTMNIGFLETSKLLGSFVGFLYTFTKSDEDSMAFVSGYLNFMFQISGIQIDAKTRAEIVQYACGFKPSALSEQMEQDGYGYEQMVEALAYLAGIDPAALYRYNDFIRLLINRLNRITITDLDPNSEDLMGRLVSLGREGITAAVHGLIVSSKGEAGEALRWIGRLFPSEFSLAYVWYFLEVAYERARYV